MAQYIDKSALVAEIERRIKRFREEKDSVSIVKTNTYKGIISFLDTLEVKEIDLEKEVDTWRHNHFHGRRDKDGAGEYLERSSQLDLAKHFFELGLKAPKGE